MQQSRNNRAGSACKSTPGLLIRNVIPLKSHMPHIDLSAITPATFPAAEDDAFEFKRSATPHNELKKKLDRAASGFANAGGGCFIYGIDGNGDPDGGIDPTVGRQDLRDWLDQIVARVTPPVSYEIQQYDDAEGRGTIDPGKVIAAVSIHPSDTGPHQASDNKYYIRAGAHTLPAGHYLVEALWARRYAHKPVLTHMLREKPSASGIVQVGVVALTDAPAIDVEFTLSPLKGLLAKLAKYFPIRLPVVDRNNPFYLDVSLMRQVDEELTDDVKVTIAYKDYAGNTYSHQSDGQLSRSLRPITIGTEAEIKIAKALEKLEKPLNAIAKKK
jgi:hypothetical protein